MGLISLPNTFMSRAFAHTIQTPSDSKQQPKYKEV